MEKPIFKKTQMGDKVKEKLNIFFVKDEDVQNLPYQERMYTVHKYNHW